MGAKSMKVKEFLFFVVVVVVAFFHIHVLSIINSSK